MQKTTQRWLTAFLLIVVSAVVALTVALRYYSPLTRDWVVKTLESRYNSKVEIKTFQASLLPYPLATAEDIVFREQGRTDVPPFVTIRKLTIEASFFGLFETPRKIRRVRLEGLRLHIPPHEKKDPPEASGGTASQEPARLAFAVDEIVADGTFLELLPRQAGKEPKQFEIRELRLRSIGPNEPMSFVSTLMNAKPPGEIHSKGQFGPWRRDEPGDTPVSGTYTFKNANLGVFKGIAGTLSSVGRYGGALDRIEVDGTTDTPDFRVTESGNSVDLKTEFHALVDGTNGDTFLVPVKAQFLHSTVLARGGIYGKPNVKGKTISLDINLAGARVEDLLRLAMKTTPGPLTGQIDFQAKLIILPGERKVLDKMQLYGDFGIASARFTSFDLQRKITMLSQRSRGQTEDDPSEHVISNMNGHFDLRDATARLSRLVYSVPGANIRLTGSYGIHGETLNFDGMARLDAKPSQMTTGIKSILLKVVDPLFWKNGATEIPFRIGGTRSQPSFGLAFGRKKP